MSKPNTHRKKFEDMSRDELLATKEDVAQQLARVQAQLNLVKTDLLARGKTLKPTDSPDLQSRKANLSWVLTKVIKELKRYKSPGDDSPATQAESFQRTAKLLLEEGLYQHILEQSRQ